MIASRQAQKSSSLASQVKCICLMRSGYALNFTQNCNLSYLIPLPYSNSPNLLLLSPGNKFLNKSLAPQSLVQGLLLGILTWKSWYRKWSYNVDSLDGILELDHMQARHQWGSYHNGVQCVNKPCHTTVTLLLCRNLQLTGKGYR